MREGEIGWGLEIERQRNGYKKKTWKKSNLSKGPRRAKISCRET